MRLSQTKSRRTIDSSSVNSLSRCQFHIDTSQRHHKFHITRRSRTRIIIRSQSHRQTSRNHILSITVWQTKEERSTRQYRRDSIRITQTLNLNRSSTFEVVHRKRIIFHTHLHTARHIQLISMYFRTHTILRTHFKHTRSLFHRKETLIAEHINKISQTLFCHSRNHLITNQIHIFPLATLICRWHSMRTQEISTNSQWSSLLQSTNHTQHLEFILSRQTITTLNISRTRTKSNHLIHTLKCLFIQSILRSIMQTLSRIQNTTTTLSNLLITQTIDFINKFMLTTTSINNMSMTITKCRQHKTTLSINHLISSLRSLRHRTKRLNHIIFHQKISILNLRQNAHRITCHKRTNFALNLHQTSNIFNQCCHRYYVI